MCKIQCLLILLAFQLIAIIAMIFFDGKLEVKILNFEAGFIGFLLVMVANFFSFNKKISNELQKLETLETKDRKKQRFSNFVLGISVSSSLWRILAYVFFCLILFCLMHYHFFSIVWVIIGILTCLILILILQSIRIKKQSSEK